MKTTRYFLPICLSFCGCVSTLPPGEKQRSAPTNAQKATVYVIDDLGGFGLPGNGEEIIVNDAAVGALSRRQYIWFYIKPGTMAISMNDPAIKSRKMSAEIFKVEAGKTYSVRYRIEHRPSDAELLADIVSERAKNRTKFRAEDLTLISQTEASQIMAAEKLVGSKDP